MHTYPDVYKVASKIIGLTQFWAADIPLSVRHISSILNPHPLVYLGGPEVGVKGKHSHPSVYVGGEVKRL